MSSKSMKAGRIIFVIVFLMFSGLIAMMILPSEKSAEVNGLVIKHTEDKEGKAFQPQLEIAEITSKADSISVKLHYYRKGVFNTLEMAKLPGTDFYGVEVPADTLGQRNYYYLEAVDGAGNRVVLPKTATDTYKSEYDYFQIRYEGKASFALLLLHIVLMIMAVFLLIHAFYYAMNYLFTGERENAITRSVNIGTITFFITGFPIGCIIEKQVLGNYWEGVPFGWDITDSKTLIILVMWVILIRLQNKNKISMRCYSKWVIINTIITLILFMLPHSI
jgi:hypothetical protein